MSIKDINVDFPHDLKKGRISHDFSKDMCEFTMLKNQDPVPLHTHNFDELVFIFSGSAVHVVDDDKYPIIRGDVFVVRGNHKHGYDNPKHLNVVNVLYQREYFESLKIKFANLPGFNALFVHEPMYRKKHKFKSKLHLNSQQLQKISRLLNFMIVEQNNEWAGTPASKDGKSDSAFFLDTMDTMDTMDTILQYPTSNVQLRNIIAFGFNIYNFSICNNLIIHS